MHRRGNRRALGPAGHGIIMTTLYAGHQYPAELALEIQGRLQDIFSERTALDGAQTSNHRFAKNALNDILHLWDGYIKQVANFVMFAARAPGRATDFVLVDPGKLAKIDQMHFDRQVEKIEMLCPDFIINDETRHDIREISLARHAINRNSTSDALRNISESDLLRWHATMLSLIGRSASAIAEKYRDVGPYSNP